MRELLAIGCRAWRSGRWRDRTSSRRPAHRRGLRRRRRRHARAGRALRGHRPDHPGPRGDGLRRDRRPADRLPRARHLGPGVANRLAVEDRGGDARRTVLLLGSGDREAVDAGAVDRCAQPPVVGDRRAGDRFQRTGQHRGGQVVVSGEQDPARGARMQRHDLADVHLPAQGVPGPGDRHAHPAWSLQGGALGPGDLAASPVASRSPRSTGCTNLRTSTPFTAGAAQSAIFTPIRMRSPARSSSPYAAMFVTGRCPVDVGSPVDCWISPSVSAGRARENASRISVILRAPAASADAGRGRSRAWPKT